MGTLDGRVVLFGGATSVNADGPVLADTWTWDGAAWTQLDVVGPPARQSASMAAGP
jgi:hypothetical protein